jgi:transposase-like protein
MRRERKEEATQRGLQGARGDGGTVGGEELAELSSKFGVHPTMISTWKQELIKRASELFARGNKAPTVDDAQRVIDDLHRKIGQLQVERDFLAGQPAISRLLRGGR